MPRNTKSGRLRIIAGQWRGRRLSFPDTGAVRPTPDNVRETLFNWLAPALADAACLDLYSGSGALGLEAMSRGAARVDFVESDRNCTQAIDLALEQFNASESDVEWTTHTATVERYLGATSRQWDIVFLDPPFGSALAWPTVEALVTGNALKPGAQIYVETERKLDPPELDLLTIRREKKHGRTTSRLLMLKSDLNESP